MSDEALIQRSPEWHAARLGSLGASQVHDALARTKTGWGASRANLRTRLVIERLTGKAQETYQNAAMLTGIEREPEARAAYAFDRDVDVQEVGLIRHPAIPRTHASPDGLVGDDGMVEIKCPGPAAHLEIVTKRTVPLPYMLQCYWQLACSGRAWNDFVSYQPDFPDRLRLFVLRVPRDETRIAQIEQDVRAFLAEVDQAVAELERLAA